MKFIYFLIFVFLNCSLLEKGEIRDIVKKDVKDVHIEDEYIEDIKDISLDEIKFLEDVEVEKDDLIKIEDYGVDYIEDEIIKDIKDIKDVKDVEEKEEVSKCPSPGYKKIGQVCQDDCDCETKLCYKEAYMDPYHFCTKVCEVIPPCPQGNGCINFTSKQKEKYKLKLPKICIPLCETVEDCKKISESFTHCPKKETNWDGETISGPPTCQFYPTE